MKKLFPHSLYILISDLSELIYCEKTNTKLDFDYFCIERISGNINNIIN